MDGWVVGSEGLEDLWLDGGNTMRRVIVLGGWLVV